MGNNADKKTATAKDSARKRKPVSPRSSTEKKKTATKAVTKSSGQLPAGAVAKPSVLASDPSSIESEGMAVRTAKSSDAVLHDDSLFDEAVQNQDVVRFTLAEQVYGLPVLQIVQVLRIVAFNIVPDPPQGMLGIIDFRGRIIPLIDLRCVFDLPPQSIGLNTPVLVARTFDRLMGLVVDEVMGVSALSVGVQVFTNGNSRGVRYISGAARLDGKTMLIVNLEELEKQFPDVILRTT